MRVPVFLPRLCVLACILTSFLALPALAQTYDFVGLVQDGQRGEPIGGAEIFTPEGRKLGVSQSTGRFEVSVNNRRAHVIFKRKGFKDLDVDLAEVPQLIDVEVSMESDVQELAEVTTFTTRKSHDPSQAQSIEELESLQGMRIDLNDHLRQLHGVAGMNEFTSDISVNGSRTQDVTHYLGRSRIPSLRHLDFGYPGNQSVLNPRLLKSVTLSDNLAKGPLNQGNASALVYDLKDGDPEAIHADLVFGSVDKELNMNGYWGGRTLLLSARYLDNGALGNLGAKYFTDAKNPGNPDPNTPREALTDPLSFTSGDLFLGTFLRDTTGAYSRHSLIVLSDDYMVQEDLASTAGKAIPQTLVSGFQGAWLYSHESVTPSNSGDWESGFSLLRRNYRDEFHDTLAPIPSYDGNTSGNILPWYAAGATVGGRLSYLLGTAQQTDWQSIWSLQWSPSTKTLGAQPSYGVELEYHHQERLFTDIPSDLNSSDTLKRDLVQGNALYRLHWNLPKQRGLDFSVGVSGGYEAPFSGDQPGLLTPLPLASLRYTHPLGDDHKVFGEIAVRQATEFEPAGYNLLKAKSTPSAEGLVGGNGALGNPFRYAWSGYTRMYSNPLLPVPDVFWNYQETRASDYALVKGGNATLNWLPVHHFGVGMNGSVIQGTYHMKDALGSLPWESNRTLDFVTNMRILPRADSALSLIITYTVSNGRPLYEYHGLWDSAFQTNSPDGRSTNQRAVFQSSGYPEVSRKRLDMRINIDLLSRWRPLESMRFFFEADNIFADYEGNLGGWLGGTNRRQRGWTRPAGENGDLDPVVSRGLGFFIMFGLEGHLKI